MVSFLWMGCCLSARVLEGQPASRICDNEAAYAANHLLPMLPPECNLAFLTPPAVPDPGGGGGGGGGGTTTNKRHKGKKAQHCSCSATCSGFLCVQLSSRSWSRFTAAREKSLQESRSRSARCPCHTRTHSMNEEEGMQTNSQTNKRTKKCLLALLEFSTTANTQILGPAIVDRPVCISLNPTAPKVNPQARVCCLWLPRCG